MPSRESAPLDTKPLGQNDRAQAESDDRAEASLDVALEESFPASDPIASNRFD